MPPPPIPSCPRTYISSVFVFREWMHAFLPSLAAISQRSLNCFRGMGLRGGQIDRSMGDSNRFAVIFFDKPGLRRGRGIAVNRSRGLVEGRIERERKRYTRLSCLQNEDVVVWTLPHGEKQDPMPGTRGKKPMIPVIHETFYAGWPE